MRFGFQMNVDSSTAEVETAIASPATKPGHGPADRPRQPPRHERPRRSRPARSSAVTASGESPPVRNAAGDEQVVVERAVVDVADRGRRAEQRDHAVAHEGAQHQHVVALVGVPRAARGQVGSRSRPPARAGRSGPGRARAPASTGVHAGRHVAARPRVSAGGRAPVRARLPRSVIASGGRSASGRPAAMS